jgi:hypothetical protein
MQIRQTIAALIGQTLLLIGLGVTFFYGLISYNDRTFEWLGLATGIGLMISGVLIIKYGARATLKESLSILLDLWP